MWFTYRVRSDRVNTDTDQFHYISSYVTSLIHWEEFPPHSEFENNYERMCFYGFGGRDWQGEGVGPLHSLWIYCKIFLELKSEYTMWIAGSNAGG